MDRWPESRREPDGVAVDPQPAPTSGARRADANDTVVALSPPPSIDAAVGTVRAFFDAVAREDANALALLTDHASWANPSLPARAAVPALPTFRERFRRFDYRLLPVGTIFRERDVEVYEESDLAAPSPGRPTRPPEMTANDVLVCVRIPTPRVGADRLYGDEIRFVLRPASAGFRIAHVLEDFPLPLVSMNEGPVAGGTPSATQCTKCGAFVGISGGRCPFCGTEMPNVAPSGPSSAALLGLTDVNRMSMGRPPVRKQKKSNAGLFIVASVVFTVAVVGGGATVWLLRRPVEVPTTASARAVALPPPPAPAKTIAGIAVVDLTKVDPTDYLPKAKQHVEGWDEGAHLLEISVIGAKNGWVDLTTPGTEIVYRYIGDRRDPRAPKSKETRQRMQFDLKADGPAEPETTAAVASDRPIGEPTCVWSAAWRAAVAAGIPKEGPVDAKLAATPKSDDVTWVFTSGNVTRSIDAMSCAIKGH